MVGSDPDAKKLGGVLGEMKGSVIDAQAVYGK